MQYADDVNLRKSISNNSPMTIEKVMEQAKTYLHNPVNLNSIMDAYILAEKQHRGQFRKSGEPYIQHPLEIAYMLTTLTAGPATICAGLLHDVVEDTNCPIEEIQRIFGNDVASIVDGVTKIGKLKYMTKEKALAKDHQKILIAMAKDIRVVMVKLVDRVHNMRTLQFQPAEKQKTIAKETLDLYAPLAHRLGMYRIKAELEDLSFRYLDPEKYFEIEKMVNEHRLQREEYIVKMQDRIKDILNENNISNFEIKGRIKNIFSVSKKMKDKNKSFEQIYDLLALRILVPTVEDCYHVLGLVHAEWTPLPLRFKDYIAIPKPNLYQSLHTTVIGINGNVYEIQIRTYKMDDIAEMGVAAHWGYKEENKSYTPEKEQAELSEKLRWYRELLTYAQMGEEEGKDPLQNIKEELFLANIYVFTPRGDVIDLANGATPLDFAYRIHTEVGNHTVGAIVNGKIVPLTYKLQTGDVAEIKTNKNFNGPTDAWLKIVKTTHAKHKIISILNNRKRDSYIEDGRLKFEEVLKEIPRVRKDFGYPPLVTPLSQMVGTQAVMNVLFKERYKACPKEIIEYLKGNYGKAPAEVNEEVRKKIIGDAPIITHRPADDIAPEFEAMKAKYAEICETDEDVLSCALFEQVAVKFLEGRKAAKLAESQENEVEEFNIFIG